MRSALAALPSASPQASASLLVVMRALADPTRLRLLVLLGEAERLCLGEEPGELCVCDLVSLLDVPQPTASRHLATLKRAGLVSCRKVGPWCHYRLCAPSGATGRHLLAAVRAAGEEDRRLAADVAQVRVRQASLCGPSIARAGGGACC